MRIVVSSCLLGNKCKYNGGDNRHDELIQLLQGHDVVAVCPEMLGGLPAPRQSCEIIDGVVCTKDGDSKDLAYRVGAQKALKIALNQNVQLAILQARSPSCGVHHIYDGTFSKKLIEGKGVFAALLKETEIKSFDTEDMDEIRQLLKKTKNTCKKLEIE